MRYKTLEAQVLHKARKLVASDHEAFICLAVGQVAGEFTPPEHVSRLQRKLAPAASRVNARINRLLSGYPTLNAWISVELDARNGRTGFKRFIPQDEKAKQTRLLWIDDMIKWWEQHGERA
jgi:hypothetical protein